MRNHCCVFPRVLTEPVKTLDRDRRRDRQRDGETEKTDDERDRQRQRQERERRDSERILHGEESGRGGEERQREGESERVMEKERRDSLKEKRFWSSLVSGGFCHLFCWATSSDFTPAERRKSLDNASERRKRRPDVMDRKQ